MPTVHRRELCLGIIVVRRCPADSDASGGSPGRRCGHEQQAAARPDHCRSSHLRPAVVLRVDGSAIASRGLLARPKRGENCHSLNYFQCGGL